ncbi:MAG: DUF2520 domain-containing protein [Smithella sp.]|jgi:predicted short-subunit dehydrogenase-like oxidoreductase (DUF2520 family)|nr:DUF2520 domain-containing protein [Smithella sp.]
MTKTKNPMTFAIIGTGMVGTAIGILLKKAGHLVSALADTSPAHLRRAAARLGKIPTFHDPGKPAAYAACLLITTPDDIIAQACAQAVRGVDMRGKTVFHMSGAGGLDLLESAAQAGAKVACIHPLQSFSTIEGAVQSIPGSYFGVTAGRGAKALASAVVRDLGGIPLVITSGQKPLYHLAACMASNYLVSLMSLVESAYLRVGFSRKDARRAFLPLVYGSLKNIEAHGCAKALTGPIARSDAGTIRKHMQALAEAPPEIASVYAELGRITVKLAMEKGTLKPDQAKTITGLLKGVKK